MKLICSFRPTGLAYDVGLKGQFEIIVECGKKFFWRRFRRHTSKSKAQNLTFIEIFTNEHGLGI